MRTIKPTTGTLYVDGKPVGEVKDVKLDWLASGLEAHPEIPMRPLEDSGTLSFQVKLDHCPLCIGDGWLEIPKVYNVREDKLEVWKVRCPCGAPTDEPGLLSIEEFKRMQP